MLLRLNPTMVNQRACIGSEAAHRHPDVLVNFCYLFYAARFLHVAALYTRKRHYGFTKQQACNSNSSHAALVESTCDCH